ncbi:MAG: hypothetical protein ACJ77K_13815 [Bacteroidia bacterium]
MNRNLLFLFFFLLITFRLSAQYDSIKFVSGAKHAAKIIEVTEKYVKYKNPLDTLGPVYKVARRDVEGFIMKGECLSLEQLGYVNCVKDPTFDIIKEKDFTRTIIGVDVMQFFVRHFELKAEQVFKNRKVSLGCVLNLGLSDETEKDTYKYIEPKLFDSGQYKKYFFGLEAKFFPKAHTKYTYYYSFGVDYGRSFRYQLHSDSLFYPYPNNQYFYGWNTYYTYSAADYFAYRFENGVVCRFTRNFVLEAAVSIGASQYRFTDVDSGKMENHFFPKVGATLLLARSF